MKRVFAGLISAGLIIGLCSCENPGNPTIDGDYVWENSEQQTESVNYDLNYSYTLNRNVADTLAAQQREGLTEERLKLAQDILAELDKYPEYSDDPNINYIIKLRKHLILFVSARHENSYIIIRG